jgi:putative FmdB family regulatory protein
MPTYDYQCNSCGYTYELFQSMSEEPAKICPQCRGSVKRLIAGGAGIIFKGSGFYVTDNKKNSSQKGDSPKSPAASDTGGETKKAPEDKKPSEKKEPAAVKN